MKVVFYFDLRGYLQCVIFASAFRVGSKVAYAFKVEQEFLTENPIREALAFLRGGYILPQELLESLEFLTECMQ